MLTSFPALSPSEFASACQAIESRFRHTGDTTHWTSVEWKSEALFIKAVYTGNNAESIQSTSPRDDVSTVLDGADKIEDDEHTLQRPKHLATTQSIVEFSITLSPTYQVPVLWFTFSQTPPHGPKGIDAVYQYLVPQRHQAGLHEVGVMGGISMTHHPITDLSAFFIHPCNTIDALRDVACGLDLDPERYLMLWLGLVGSAVNLYVPSKLLLQQKSIMEKSK